MQHASASGLRNRQAAPATRCTGRPRASRGPVLPVSCSSSTTAPLAATAARAGRCGKNHVDVGSLSGAGRVRRIRNFLCGRDDTELRRSHGHQRVRRSMSGSETARGPRMGRSQEGVHGHGAASNGAPSSDADLVRATRRSVAWQRAEAAHGRRTPPSQAICKPAGPQRRHRHRRWRRHRDTRSAVAAAASFGIPRLL